MVCRRLTSLIVTLLVLLQSMESLALTFEGNKELAKKANKYEEMLKSRKLIMAKTNEAEKPKMEGLSDSKSFKISGLHVLLLSTKNRLQRSLSDQTSNNKDKNRTHDSSYQNLESKENLRVSDDPITLMNKDYHFDNAKGRHKPPINNALPYKVAKP